MNLYAHRFFERPLDPAEFDAHLHRLPEVFHAPVRRHNTWQGRHTALFGKVLLQTLLHRAGYPTDALARLRVGPHGKPFLNDRVDFNVAHSGGLVVVALSDESPVGIDAEKIRPVALEDLRGAMRPDEYAALRGQPEAAFFAWWTRKESLAKATGQGLSHGLGGLRVTDAHGTVHPGSPAGQWWFYPLPAPPGYAVTLCLQKKDLTVSYLHSNAGDGWPEPVTDWL